MTKSMLKNQIITPGLRVLIVLYMHVFSTINALVVGRE